MQAIALRHPYQDELLSRQLADFLGEADPAVLGAPFFVMGFVAGVVPVDSISAPNRRPAARSSSPGVRAGCVDPRGAAVPGLVPGAAQGPHGTTAGRTTDDAINPKPDSVRS